MADGILVDNAVILDNSGNPLANGTVTIFETGTTTLFTLYSDSAGTVVTSNPVELDASGRMPQTFINTSTAVKSVIRTEGGAQIREIDPVPRVGQAVNTAANVGISPIVGVPRTGTSETDVQGALEELAARIVPWSDFTEDTLLPATSAPAWRTELGLGSMSLLNEADRSLNQSTWNAGSSTTEALVSPEKLNATIADYLSDRQAKSGQLSISASGETTWSHGLSSTPDLVTPQLVCITADSPFSVGDRALVGPGRAEFSGAATTDGCVIEITSTQVKARFGPEFYLLTNAATPAAHSIDFAKWELVFAAQAF